MYSIIQLNPWMLIFSWNVLRFREGVAGAAFQ
jgi:hypothetical protein